MWRHDVEQLARRWRAFGWHAIVVDGHDLNAILDAYAEARSTTGQPTMIVARTLKGKGVSFVEGKDGWHGKPFKKGEELDRALAELEQAVRDAAADRRSGRRKSRSRRRMPAPPPPPKPIAPPAYKAGDQVATREAYGTALAKLGEADLRVVALDADVKNSTFSDKFEKVLPDRFYQNFIAEQVMIGAAMGLAARGAIPFPSTFACFLTRAADFIRMAAISNVSIKMAGSHAGVSIGEDGPSQMALEDLAMCRAQPNITVLYPCDAVSTERLMALAGQPSGPGLHAHQPAEDARHLFGEETFTIGGMKVLRESSNDAVTVVGAGVTVFEALKAYDQLKAAGTAIRVVDLYSLAADRQEGPDRRRQRHGRADHHGRGSLCGRRNRRRRRRSGGGGRHPRPSDGRPRDPPKRQAGRTARPLRDLREPHRYRCAFGRGGREPLISFAFACCSGVRIWRTSA